MSLLWIVTNPGLRPNLKQIKGCFSKSTLNYLETICLKSSLTLSAITSYRHDTSRLQVLSQRRTTNGRETAVEVATGSKAGPKRRHWYVGFPTPQTPAATTTLPRGPLAGIFPAPAGKLPIDRRGERGEGGLGPRGVWGGSPPGIYNSVVPSFRS